MREDNNFDQIANNVLKVKMLSCMMIPFLSWLYLFIVIYFRLMYSNLWSYRHLELASVDVISSYFAVEVQRTHKLHVFHFISTLLIKVSLIKSKLLFFSVLAWACRLLFYADSLVRTGKTNQRHYCLSPFAWGYDGDWAYENMC